MTIHSIDDQARELISAWAKQHAPSAELRERTWAAVQDRASAGELGPELEPEPGSIAATIGSGSSGGVRLVLLGIGLAAVIGGVALTAKRDSTPAIAVEAVELELEPVASPPPTEPERELPSVAPSELSPAPEPASIEPTEEAPRARTSKRSTSKIEAPSDEVDSLDLEMQLLGAARTALKSGNVDAALERLDEHAKRFPNGALRSERELSRITALCKAGRLDAAEAAARRFIAAHPKSTQAKRLHDTCIGDRL